MPVAIKVPAVGESITEGTIARWLKKNGDFVQQTEPLVELETEKATTMVPSPAAGKLTITVPEGKSITIGSVIGQIEVGIAAPATVQADGNQAPATPRQENHARTAQATPVERHLSPAARQLAADEGIDLSQIAGSGRSGTVTKEDVLAHLQHRAPLPLAKSVEAPPPATPPLASPVSSEARETRQRMSSLRARIAERLLAAQQNAAILTTFNEADLSAVQALRASYKEPFQKKHGVGLGFLSFFVKACVEALKAFPAVNARIDSGDIVYHHYHNIGVAVSTEKGLMVPVLRDADRMSFAAIEKAIADLAEKARAGKITVDDLQGGTFTITNGGIFGSLLSTPILNPPQSGILGMHAIQKRPVVVDDQIVIRPMMYLALSYDHRLIDGREAVNFLVRVKECIEKPERLMLEV
jgi:2-oxoglutarate dehydrogenase E2 component (dihydrolipoamide succinyltransferase)